MNNQVKVSQKERLNAYQAFLDTLHACRVGMNTEKISRLMQNLDTYQRASALYAEKPNALTRTSYELALENLSKVEA